jgi:multidrug efflux pump subunit AcrA (membrane-fusion protein)
VDTIFGTAVRLSHTDEALSRAQEALTRSREEIERAKAATARDEARLLRGIKRAEAPEAETQVRPTKR